MLAAVTRNFTVSSPFYRPYIIPVGTNEKKFSFLIPFAFPYTLRLMKFLPEAGKTDTREESIT
jgi:hypothetical protein